MEEKLTNYLNERLKKYKDYLRSTLLLMFGSEYETIINDAFNIPVLYVVVFLIMIV